MGRVRVMRPPHRGWSIVAGCALLLAGIVFLWAPVVASVATGVWLGATLLVLGIVLGVGSALAHGPGWGWSVARGVLAAVVGLLLFRDPAAAVVGLTFALGVYFAGAGAARIGLAVAWHPFVGWGAMLASGILGLLLAALVLAGWPANSFVLLGTLLGIEACVDGIAMLAAIPGRVGERAGDRAAT